MDNDNNTNEATYCPQDNKLRLYVGYIPREDYLALRKDGWKATPKQDCDFVATWTPEREDTALEYGQGIIGDEDQTPQDRAVDRAERFAGYRDKRTAEAIGHADRYEAGPKAHGYQNAAKAERAAAKHDRIGDRATSQWSKAEYWTNRTAGVIKNALYKDLPAVRMTRIKEIEKVARRTADRTDERGQRWNAHCELRLAYERQMIAAQGGMAEDLDIQAGGMFAGQLIHGVTRSQATKRVSSVKIMMRKTWGENKGQMVLSSVKIERYGKDAYTPPTPETLAQLAEIKKAQKEAKKLLPKKPSLINPTEDDAQKLQDLLNSRAREESHKQEIIHLTQAQYAAHSKGTYARLGTKFFCGGGRQYSEHWNAVNTEKVCKVRLAPGKSDSMGWSYSVPDRVIVISDKPQKSFPQSLWNDPRAEYLEEVKARFSELREIMHRPLISFNAEEKHLSDLWDKAKMCGVVSSQSLSQFSWTSKGEALVNELV